MSNHSDATRLFGSKDTSSLNDNTVLSNDEFSEQIKDSDKAQTPYPSQKATKTSSTTTGSHFAAAGAGIAVGAGVMAAVNATGATSRGPKSEAELNALNNDKDNASDEIGITNNIATKSEDNSSADENSLGNHLFDTVSAKDVSTDQVTEISIDPTSGEPTITPPNNSTINFNINVNHGGNTATPPEVPLHVSGPNPAEAVHQAGINMHQNNASAEVPNVDTTYHQQQVIETDPVDMNINDITSATGVNDSMSFSNAFSTARAEVGPGGSFTWHGQIYGTYYENEWNAMSPIEQQQFQIAAVQGHTHSTAVDEQLYTAKTDRTFDLDEGQYIDNYDDEVHVINISETSDDNDGVYNYAQIDINGTTAVVVDTDHDMIYDVMHIDIDGDQHVTANELCDISEYNLSTDDVAQQMMIQESQEQAFAIDDSVDFDNNMDTSNFDD